MPRSKRLITWVAILIQAYAVWFVLSRSQLWPYMLRENKLVSYLGVFLLYLLGDRVMHGLVTSEVVRKTQLEADQIAAQQIQKTLQPEKLEELVGYELQVFCEPFRAVGGDYFDVVHLPGNRTLLAVADVSGRGWRQPCSQPTFRLSSGALRALMRRHWYWLIKSINT